MVSVTNSSTVCLRNCYKISSELIPKNLLTLLFNKFNQESTKSCPSCFNRNIFNIWLHELLVQLLPTFLKFHLRFHTSKYYSIYSGHSYTNFFQDCVPCLSRHYFIKYHIKLIMDLNIISINMLALFYKILHTIIHEFDCYSNKFTRNSFRKSTKRLFRN